MIDQSILDETVTLPATNEAEESSDLTLVGKFPEIIDSSIMGQYKACAEAFRKAYLQHWKPRTQSVHLHAGGAFAKGLEVTRRAFYTGEYEYLLTTPGVTGDKVKTWTVTVRDVGDAESAIACGLQALLAFYGDFKCPPESAKSAERMAGAFEFYFSNYPLDFEDGYPIELPGGKRAIEFSFAHPLPILHPVTGNPLLYVGRMDAIIQYAGGIYICDEKTTTQLGASWPRQWDLRAQFTGYAWGCAQSGIKVEGAIVRGVSILKTKYDTAQSINYRPEWQIDRWYNELLEWVEDMKLNFERKGPDQQWRHNLDHSCAEYGGCQFRESCLSQDEQPWLETAFERRVWNPLLRTETKT
jgi:hypothetical protein